MANFSKKETGWAVVTVVIILVINVSVWANITGVGTLLRELFGLSVILIFQLIIVCADRFEAARSVAFAQRFDLG